MSTTVRNPGPMQYAHLRPVIVWGNCQAAPLADLLRAPLARHGLDVPVVPPVHLLDEASLARVQQLLPTAALLVTQPIGDDYRLPGCGTAAVSALLPADARVVTFGVAHHVGAFPFQTNAHGGDGARVLAPVTDYHDLRAVVAASRSMSAAEALRWWPAPEPDAVRAVADVATVEYARRETNLDVRMGDDLLAPDALWTMTHPTNRSLAQLAHRVLAALGLDEPIDVPEREFLGQRRAPIEAAVADALGWPTSSVRELWIVDDQEVEPLTLLERQLAFYAARPDVVEDTLVRQRGRLRLLGLAQA